MPSVRKPVVAGAFYPAGKKELSDELDLFLSGAGGEKRDKLLGGIVPHAGYEYSGPCAAKLYSIIPANRFKTIVILGTNHTGLGAPVSISPAEYWETPLGKVPVNSALSEKLSDSFPEIFSVESIAHSREHSIEVQLPFLQSALGAGFSILPIVIGADSLELCRETGEALAGTIDRRRTLLIASSDMNHYEPQAATMMKDGLAIDSALSLSGEKLYDAVRRNAISMCGVLPATTLLFALASLGARKAELLEHYTSGDVVQAPASQGVVGYASVAFY